MLTRDNLEDFKSALTSALRTTSEADGALLDRYVELRPGLMRSLNSKTNHLLVGRRGVGKSTTLAVMHQRARDEGSRVIHVDVETHKAREYPDVLIEIILDVLDELRPAWYAVGKWRLRRRIQKLQRVLTDLRDSPPEVTQRGTREDSLIGHRDVELSGSAAKSFFKLAGAGGRSRTRRSVQSTTHSVVRKKEDFLRDLAPAIAEVLRDTAPSGGAGALILVLDDFYFVAQAEQPSVLDHLHTMTKQSNVWLKIGSVGSRTQTFYNGDPPIGMQPPNDLQTLSLDVGLSDFNTAKTFLEDVTDGVLATVKLRVKDVVTETARERAVLIVGGGVPRDYFDLLISAADQAWERAQSGDQQAVRISAEDVQSAAGRRLERKRQDFRNDAGREAEHLDERFADLVRFARDRDTYFVLVPSTEIDSSWGREIVELEDLRLVHRIMTVRPNTGTWRGVDTVVFMMDIPALVEKRMQKAPIEFWKPRQSDALRRASWVYEPGWEATGPRRARRRDQGTPDGDDQPLLDSALPEGEEGPSSNPTR